MLLLTRIHRKGGGGGVFATSYYWYWYCYYCCISNNSRVVRTVSSFTVLPVLVPQPYPLRTPTAMSMSSSSLQDATNKDNGHDEGGTQKRSKDSLKKRCVMKMERNSSQYCLQCFHRSYLPHIRKNWNRNRIERMIIK